MTASGQLRWVDPDDNVLVSSVSMNYLIILSYMTITPSVSTTRDIVYSLIASTLPFLANGPAVRWRVVTSSRPHWLRSRRKLHQLTVTPCPDLLLLPSFEASCDHHAAQLSSTPFLLHNNIYTCYSSYVLLTSLCMLILKIFIILI